MTALKVVWGSVVAAVAVVSVLLALVSVSTATLAGVLVVSGALGAVLGVAVTEVATPHTVGGGLLAGVAVGVWLAGWGTQAGMAATLLPALLAATWPPGVAAAWRKASSWLDRVAAAETLEGSDDPLPLDVLRRIWAETAPDLEPGADPTRRLEAAQLRAQVLDELEQRFPEQLEQWLLDGGPGSAAAP